MQTDNFPRGNLTPAEVEMAIGILCSKQSAEHRAKLLDVLLGAPLDLVSSCLRGMLTAAPGCDLAVVDFSNIEGRMLAWLAGEEWKLDAFRDFDAKRGPDLYLVMAALIYGVPVSSLNKKSPERQDGKTCELACRVSGRTGCMAQDGVNSVGCNPTH